MINGIQQMGIGVLDAKRVFNWYRIVLGFDILVFEDESVARLMVRYTDGVPMERYALLAMNLMGGGGLEIWQFKHRTPRPPGEQPAPGDLGINAMKIRAANVKEVHSNVRGQNNVVVSKIHSSDQYPSFIYFKDPWQNWVQIVEDPYQFCRTKFASGGVMGAVISVSDMP
ncbi:MAG TPA: hypothetical protein VKN36_09975 [Eudoraea sp.]|nr:hypothetical protein [Eudoraea sp.]